MAKYKEEKNSGKAAPKSESVYNGAAGYEYTPGDGSDAEKRDQMRGVQKSTESGSKVNSGATATGGSRSRNTSPTVSSAVNAVNVATGITNGYTPTGTYNDAGLRAGENGLIDPITQYKMQYEAAKARGDQAGMDAAHQLAENYRAQFGYSGGADGSENIGITPTAIQQVQEEIPAYEIPEYQIPSFSYTPFDQTATGQTARAEYEKLLQQLNDYKAFEYDPATDPTYQQYADSYTRSGQRAMQDVLGQLAARTGGLASSYAGTMAQQQYDQYMAELANKVPELRQLAYSMYVDDYNRMGDKLNRAYQQYADDYNRYMDQTKLDYDQWSQRAQLGYNSWAQQAQMGYNAYRDQVGDQQWARQMALQELENQQNQNRWQTEYNRNVYTNDRDFDYSKEIDTRNFDYQKEQDAWQRQLTEQQMKTDTLNALYDRVDRYGYMPTETDALRYGLTAAELADLQNQARHVRAADASKYYSGW